MDWIQRIWKKRIINYFSKRNNLGSKRGFTLIELILVISISSIVLGAAYTSIQSVSRLSARQGSQINNQNDTRIIMNYLSKDLQGLQGTSTPQVGTDGVTLYTIGSAKYYKVMKGSIAGRYVMNIFRQAPGQGDVLVMESVLDSGLAIVNPSPTKPYYDITITLIDKFNKDNIQHFQISNRTGIVASSVSLKTDTPMIDTVFAGDNIVTGSSEANAIITIKKGSTTIGTGTTDENGDYTVTLSSTAIVNDVLYVTALAPGKNISDTASTTVVLASNKRILVSPQTLYESSNNDGRLSPNTITVTNNGGGGTFKDLSANGNVFVSGLPSGLSFTLSQIGNNQFTINITGSALANDVINNTNITVTVKSSGFSGNSAHDIDSVSDPIYISFLDTTSYSVWQNCVVMVENLQLNNGPVINAPTATIVVNNNNSSPLTTSGGTANITASNLYVKGNVKLTDGTIGSTSYSTNTYIKGDVNFNWGTNIYPNFYYMGNLYFPQWMNQVTGTKVSDIVIPIEAVPSLLADSFYTQKGFTSDSITRNGMKHLSSGSYTFTNSNLSYSNVNVVSKSDILLNSGYTISGILFAPNGTVTITGGATFKGIIVAKNLVMNGGTTVQFQPFNILDLPF